MKKIKKLFNPWNWTLRWKVAVMATLIILVAYSIFALILYYSVKNNMLEGEKGRVDETVVGITRRLDGFGPPLDEEKARVSLSPEEIELNYGGGAGSLEVDSLNYYAHVLTTYLNTPNSAIAVYNDEKELVYQINHVNAQAPLTDKKQIQTTEINTRLALIASQPVHYAETGELTGYVQIFDGLNAYHERVNDMHRLFSTVALFALMLSGILGYALAHMFLTPIRTLGDNMNEIREDPMSEKRIEINESNDELAQLADTYNKMVDRLQRSVEQQKSFVTDISHELRTPVAIIQGHMDMLRRWGKDDPEILEESIDVTLAQTNRLAHLIEEMLELSRAGQIDFENVPRAEVSVLTEIKELIGSFKVLRPDFRFQMRNYLVKETKVSINTDHFKRIFIILIDNAVKYSEDHKEVHVILRQKGERVEISVEDFGKGIPEEDLERVFDRFYRVDKARNRSQGGSGLGLSIATELLAPYDGDISVESEVGKGTTFSVTFPIFEEEDETTKKTVL